MSGTIDIDIGGTFTDCYAQLGSEIAWCKTRTTGYDLSRGMLQAIEEAASRLGVSTTELLSDTDIIRYSTTLALNSLLEAKGPRLGYITTEGFEDNLLIGRGSQWSDGLSIKQQRNVARAVKPQPLINRELMVGVKARMDHRGREVRPLDEQDFLRKLDRLVDAGVRGFVVCLLWSHVNPAHERRIRELIELEYGESYLGHAQVFLSSENSPRRLEYTRATTTLLNAYLHASMYTELSGIGQRLRTGGYRSPLIMVHNTGGMASVLRSTAIQTFSGGPVAGLMGSAHLGRAYGFENVVVTDMGGTSFDIGLIVSGSTRFYQLAPTVDRWLVDATMLDTHSIGAGGGSIARINDDVGGRLEVGPESAGSMPGPGLLRPGRPGTHGDRRGPGPRLRQPGPLQRRPAAHQPGARGARAAGPHRRAARRARSPTPPSWSSGSSTRTWGRSSTRRPCSRGTTRATSSSSPQAAPGRCTRAKMTKSRGSYPLSTVSLWMTAPMCASTIRLTSRAASVTETPSGPAMRSRSARSARAGLGCSWPPLKRAGLT